DAYDFDKKTKNRGFAGLSYVYQQTVGLLFEWDNATEWKERRINFGLRYFVTPVFTVDAIGRNVPEPGTPDKERETERVLRLGYTGSF
ncbi:MAG: hypothetical protein JO102_01145, partial [Elusimicrobia bacterium]|nr:hypothetical protein [Elusimicrobiota bacterium]